MRWRSVVLWIEYKSKEFLWFGCIALHERYTKNKPQE